MKKIISFETATKVSLLLFGIFIFFHFSVIIGITLFNYVPIDFLWGGRMESSQQLLGFEIISVLIMAICFFTVLIKSERVKIPGLSGASGVILWILFALFILNTIGNLLAKTTFEKMFGIATLLSAFLCLRLALGRR